jgi:hypothetical protein
MVRCGYSLAAGVLFTALWAVSCQTKTAVESDMRIDSVVVEKTEHLLGNVNNPDCNLRLTLIYPADYANRDVLKAVQQMFIRTCLGDGYADLSPAEAAERYAEHYLKDYRELEKDFAADKREAEEKGEDAPSWYSYDEEITNEIPYNKNGIFSYAVHRESYSGGAHGSSHTTGVVMDLARGVPLMEEDIFKDDYRPELTTLLINKIALNNHLEDIKELENIGFFSIDEIAPNGNFSVNDEGITYYFNEYEIAAYVVGMIPVTLTYDEVKRLLRKDSPLYHL